MQVKDFPYTSWKDIDWNACEEQLNYLQKELTKACFNKKESRIRFLQMTICNDFYCKAIAVKRVCMHPNVSAGIDNTLWDTDYKKFNAIMTLNPENYQAKPIRRFIQFDEKKNKDRNMGVSTMFDKAMETLYSFSLDPIAEATGDRKSFAFRKGRSPQDACSFMIDYFRKENAPEWCLIGDVKSCYDSISHEWILKNIPMNKYVLKQFLKAGFLWQGSLFPSEVGISLGTAISPILGNMTLDGLEQLALSIQKPPIDYNNGVLIRFADDFVVLCKSKEYAENIKIKIEEYLKERGLILSPTKTKIVSLTEGFDFLSWHFERYPDHIHVTPAQSSVDWFYKSIDATIKEHICGDEDTLIKVLNQKIRGWATYHKTVNSQDVFKQADIIIEFNLLKWLRKIYPEKNDFQIRDLYWKRNEKGKWRIATDKNTIVKLQEMPLVVHNKVVTGKDPYVNSDYFEDRALEQQISRVSGKYRTVWDRQCGKCYYCNEKIKPNDRREIVKINIYSSDSSIKNLAYIHSKCKKHH